jgi:hypothetical protein
MFRTLRMHLLGDGMSHPAAPAEILAAIGQGRGFVAYDFARDARGTKFAGECRCGQALIMGREHEYHGVVTVGFETPFPADLRLLRHGKEVAQRHGTSLAQTVDRPGVYRAEAHLDDRPWIYTNPIYLRLKRSGERPVISHQSSVISKTLSVPGIPTATRSRLFTDD